MLKELWNKKQMYNSERFEVPASLSVYWVIYILSNVIGGVSSIFSNFSDDLESFKFALMLSLVSTVLSIGSALMAIKIYKKIGEFEESFFNNSFVSRDNITEHLIEN